MSGRLTEARAWRNIAKRIAPLERVSFLCVEAYQYPEFVRQMHERIDQHKAVARMESPAAWVGEGVDRDAVNIRVLACLFLALEAEDAAADPGVSS